jgi:hypothetical protein
MESFLKNPFQNPFGGAMNPSGGGGGVLEQIQEQVNTNGETLQSLQGGIGGLPSGNLPFGGIGGDIYSGHRGPESPGTPSPVPITGKQQEGMPVGNVGAAPYDINNPLFAGLFSGSEMSTNDFANTSPPQQTPQHSISGFRQEGDMARYVAFNDPGQGGYGFSNAEEYNAANPNRPYQQSKPTNIFDTYAMSPLQSASSSINNPAVLQPINSGTDSFPSGMLQNEMFGNMGRLQNNQFNQPGLDPLFGRAFAGKPV